MLRLTKTRLLWSLPGFGILLFCQTLAAKVAFTQEEQAWIDSNQTIKVGVDKDFRPFEFLTENEVYAGLAATYLRLVSQETGIKYEFVYDKPWKNLLQDCVSGDIDLITAIVPTPNRTEKLQFTRPYSSFANVIVTREGDDVIVGIRNLIGKKVSVEAGSFADELMTDNYQNIQIERYSTRSEALNAVATGEVDAHVGNLAQAAYIIRNNNLANLVIAAPAPFSQVDLCMASADQTLINIIDKVLANMTPEEQAKIEQDWIAVRYEHVNYMLLGRWGIAALVLILIAALWILTLQKQIKQRKQTERELVKSRQEETEARRVAENSKNLESRARASAEDAHRLAVQLTERKSEFLSIAAHDLKNPIGSIRGLANLLKEDLLERKDDDLAMSIEIVTTIEEASENMLELVNELLNVEAIESGVITANNECILMGLLLEDVIQLNKSPAQKKDITIQFNNDLPELAVTADAGRMLEVLDNLVNNAVKYSPRGSKITLCLMRSPDKPNMARFSVLDQGPGLTKNDLEKLFERFSKGSARPTGDETSTGLGLAIVRKLVEQMNGSVWAENRCDCKGAAFHCEFPVYKA